MIEREERGPVTVLRMAHGKVNALDAELCRALREALALLAAGEGAVVLTGAGGAFSAGADVLRVIDGGPGYLEAFLPALTGLAEDLFRFPRPLVAAVNGHAIGGGCVLAATADLRLMAAGGGRIGVPELLVGVAFPAIAIEAVRHATGGRGIDELALGGGVYEPDEALRRGLVDAVVPSERLLDEAVERAARMAAIPRAAFAHAKRQLRAPALERLERAGAAVDAEAAALWAGEEAQRAMRDYVARTLRR